jgi:hypothetical protein
MVTLRIAEVSPDDDFLTFISFPSGLRTRMKSSEFTITYIHEELLYPLPQRYYQRIILINSKDVLNEVVPKVTMMRLPSKDLYSII